MNPIQYDRKLITVLIVAIYLLMMHIPVPGLKLEIIESVGFSDKYPMFSIAVIALAPWLSAHIWVELAALLTSKWRNARITGPNRMGINQVVLVVWLLVCMIQSYAMVTTLAQIKWMGEPAFNFSMGNKLTYMLTLTATSAIIGLLAHLLSKYGLGSKFALFILIEPGLALLKNTYALLLTLFTEGIATPEAPPIAIGILLLLISTKALLNAKGKTGLRLSVAGVVPATLVLAVIASLITLGTITPKPLILFSFFPLLILATGALGWLQHRPKPTAENLNVSIPLLKSDLNRGLILNLAYAALAFGVILALTYGQTRLVFEATFVIYAFVVGWDILEELQARSVEPLDTIWSVHRVQDADSAINALKQAGIHAHARGLRLRQLMHIFAPWAPIDILVGASSKESAYQVLKERKRL